MLLAPSLEIQRLALVHPPILAQNVKLVNRNNMKNAIGKEWHFNIEILSLKFQSCAVAFLVKTEALAPTVNALDAMMAKLVACAKQVINAK